MREETVLITSAMTSIVLLLTIGLVLFLRRSKPRAMSLVLMGVLMSIAASVQSTVAGTYTVAGPGGGGNPLKIDVGVASGTLMKIAVILTLAGIGLLFLIVSNSRLTEQERMPAMLKNSKAWLALGGGLVVYFILFPGDLEAVVEPTRTLLKLAGEVLALTQHVSPWAYGLGAAGVGARAMMHCFGPAQSSRTLIFARSLRRSEN